MMSWQIALHIEAWKRQAQVSHVRKARQQVQLSHLTGIQACMHSKSQQQLLLRQSDVHGLASYPQAISTAHAPADWLAACTF